MNVMPMDNVIVALDTLEVLVKNVRMITIKLNPNVLLVIVTLQILWMQISNVLMDNVIVLLSTEAKLVIVSWDFTCLMANVPNVIATSMVYPTKIGPF